MFSGRTVVLAPLSHGRIEQPDRPASMQLEPCCSPASHSTPAASAVVTMSAARFVDAEPMTSRAGGPHARHNADGALASRSTHDDSPFREARAHSGGPAISVGDTTIAAGRQRPESTRSIGAACPLGDGPLHSDLRLGPPAPITVGRPGLSQRGGPRSVASCFEGLKAPPAVARDRIGAPVDRTAARWLLRGLSAGANRSRQDRRRAAAGACNQAGCESAANGAPGRSTKLADRRSRHNVHRGDTVDA